VSQPAEEGQTAKGKRERSARYPGAPLGDVVELCRFLDARGLDGLSANDIGTALGYKNIKTSAVSARLSAARQFGLLTVSESSYSLTPLARSIVHPVVPDDLPSLYRQALLSSPLYADLLQRFSGKKVPDAAILGNVLYHHHDITARAKESAAEVFLESLRFAGAIGEDGVVRSSVEERKQAEAATVRVDREPVGPIAPKGPSSPSVRIDLRLWGPDQGKVIRVRAPEAITPASFERLLQALKLHLRIEE
jgi:hypothetical protein